MSGCSNGGSVAGSSILASENSRPQSSAAAAGVGVGCTPSPLRRPICPLRNLMMAAAESLSWSDLPPELLGLVLRRLPSLADRVRLRAVCHPWRFNARLQSLPPPLPWLTLPDGTFLSIPDGENIRVDVPDGAHCYGSIDNWLLLMQKRDGGCSLMNPFSKAALDLPKLSTVWRQDWFDKDPQHYPMFFKVVVPSPLDTSPESLVAALILDNGNYSRVCICQPPVVTDMPRGGRMEPSTYIHDVAFFNGKLYGVAFGDRLLMFEIGYDLGNKPKISSTECIINSMDAYLRYLPFLSSEKACMRREYVVVCCDRLLRVKRFIHDLYPNPTSVSFPHVRTVGFAVFEADLSTNPGQWRRISKLGGQALFVGRLCSKSFAVEEYNGIQEVCIYFVCDYPWPDYPGDPFRDSGVYNMRSGKITPLLSQNAPVPQYNSGRWRPTWIFPADPL